MRCRNSPKIIARGHKISVLEARRKKYFKNFRIYIEQDLKNTAELS